MGDFGATVVGQILNGVVGFNGLAGPVIGTSDPAVTEIIGRHTVHFDFPFGVTVTPGETYVARFFPQTEISPRNSGRKYYNERFIYPRSPS